MSTNNPPDGGAVATQRKDRAYERGSVPSSYASDPKYKKYTQQVEKCLSSFDSVHEWADFIAFLKQLLKTFQSYEQFKEIPRKVVVSKRLAQCLNPALPTGVHQRALDVYSHILAVLGSEGLQRDLALWSSGLFPFFEYAATSVKPVVLNLFDTHYLPLQAGLRPLMKAFILALLPGLEEETGEYFEKVLSLLDRLSGTVSPSFFLQNIWLIMLTTPTARGTSLNFISRRLPRLKADEDISSIVGRDIGLMIRAFSAALEDDDLLVRRGALDTLLQSLPIDSLTVKRAQSEDRTILMRAAISVVLRRDLSLNRRLYSWLLGPAENSQQQIEYFKTNALELLRVTLRTEMFNPSPEYSPSRPFKIYISLLDKWEIGLPLTEVLVFDAFKAAKKAVESGLDAGDDMLMTTSTLYEAVEPHALWKQLFSRVLSGLTTGEGSSEDYQMVQYVLKTFHSHDEEIESIHLPVGFAGIMDTLASRLQDPSTRTSFTSILEVLALQRNLLERITPAGLDSRPQLTETEQAAAESQDPQVFTCTFYGLAKTSLNRIRSSSTPFITVFEDLIEINLFAARALLKQSEDLALTREVFVQSLSLVVSLVDRVEQAKHGFQVDWDPTEWSSVMMHCLHHETTTFTVVDNVITTMLKLHDTTHIYPYLSIDERSTMTSVVNTLLRYLRPSYAAYHMRAVTLIWSAEQVSTSPHVESIISQNLSTPNSLCVQETCEAFGVLWRLTDDSFGPGFLLKVPMMIVLDMLKTDDPQLRRAGETWMRCSLKSYLRVLDPILSDLFDSSIIRVPSVAEVRGKQLQSFYYERPFDQRYIIHVLEVLQSVVKFGGQGFSRIARTTPINRSSSSILLQRLQSTSATFPDASYMDVLSHVLLRFLQSEPRPGLTTTMHSFNICIQSISVDLLQAVVSRGEIDIVALQSIESVVIRKLYFCVHTARLDLQNKLLHLLHSVISASSPALDIRSKTLKSGQMDRSFEAGRPADGGQSSKPESYSVNPLMIQALVDGISTPSNRPVLQHWLDFVMMTVTQFQAILQAATTPLTDTLCSQLRAALTDVAQASSASSRNADVRSFTTDADFIGLITAVERLALLSLSQASALNQMEDENILTEKTAGEGSGLLGYVSNVFSSDSAPTTSEEQTTARSTDSRSLYETVSVLYAIWETLATQKRQPWASQEESMNLIYTRTRARCRKALEHLFRAHSMEVLEFIVDCWRRDQGGSTAFELVDVLTSSAQNVVNMLCESIGSRILGSSERVRKQSATSSLTDMMLFDFLEQYLQRLEGPLALQVWARYLQLAKDLAASFREFRAQAFPALRCFTVLGDKVSQTNALEDKRMRKEFQETYSKLLDICLLAGRSYDQGSWIRRTRGDILTANGRDSPPPRAVADLAVDEKMNASSASLLPESSKPSYGPDLVEQINLYIPSNVLPNLRRFLVDSDKIYATCASIVSNIVNPSTKGKSRPLDLDDNVLAILREMTRIGGAVKAWRNPIVDALNDNRCFSSTPDAGGKWKPMVKALFDTDKGSLAELLSKITTASSANIFTNREYEMLLRSLNLRRLAFVFLSGEKNQFLTQLPTIQEKLVDTLRNVPSAIVQSEVYLCIRVLLCRLSPHNLSSFWPVILTELYRLFDQAIATLPSDGSEDLGLILAACKLLDLLFVLQTEEFQIHQWIFITDTVDAVYRPDNWFPEAMLDRLAEVTGDLPSAENGVHAAHAQTPLLEAKPMRRPLLRALRQIDSIRDLIPFFSQASIASYESVYNSGGSVDWEAVEEGLLEDMFDGR